MKNLWLLYCIIIFSKDIQQAHLIGLSVHMLNFKKVRKCFLFQKVGWIIHRKKNITGLQKNFSSRQQTSANYIKSPKKITIRTFHGEKTTHWKYKPLMTSNQNQTLPCFHSVIKPNRTETKFTKTWTRTIRFYKSSSATFLIWFS